MDQAEANDLLTPYQSAYCKSCCTLLVNNLLNTSDRKYISLLAPFGFICHRSRDFTRTAFIDLCVSVHNAQAKPHPVAVGNVCMSSSEIQHRPLKLLESKFYHSVRLSPLSLNADDCKLYDSNFIH